VAHAGLSALVATVTTAPAKQIAWSGHRITFWLSRALKRFPRSGFSHFLGNGGISISRMAACQ
jgi:hypothetical protein